MIIKFTGVLIVVTGALLVGIACSISKLFEKPWIINSSDLPKLEAALNAADQMGIIGYDIMTERYEVATMLQREFVNDSGIFGSIIAGSEQEPSVYMDGVHHLMKTVAGVPNLRPAWFFDVSQQGEGLADTGTHLVDLVQWMLFPERAIDYRKDIKVIAAKRWATVISKAQFRNVTGEPEFPKYLSANVKRDQLDLYCNGRSEIQPVQVRRSRVGAHRQRCRDEVHRHHFEASRRVLDV